MSRIANTIGAGYRRLQNGDGKSDVLCCVTDSGQFPCLMGKWMADKIVSQQRRIRGCSNQYKVQDGERITTATA
jgi:hypothetical protein